MSVTCDDSRLKYTTGKKTLVSSWNDGIDNAQLSPTIWTRITNLKKYVQEYVNNKELLSQAVLKAELRAYLQKRNGKVTNGKQVKGQMFADIDMIIKWGENGDITNPRNGKIYAPATLANWKKVKDKLEEFDNKLSFDSITIETYNEFITWCNRYVSEKKNVKKQLKVGAINSYLASWKSLMEIGLRKKLHTNKACKEFDRIPMKIPHTVYLDDQEIARILQLPLTGMDEEIRGRYIINLFRGLRISDLKELDESLIQDNKISLTMQKSDKGVSIPLGAKIKEIMQKYDGKLPKQYSETQVNRRIKEICKAAGIDTIIRYTEIIGGKKVNQQKFKWEMITNHTARRSMVTNMLRKGISTLQAQKVVGMSQQMLERYNKLSAEENADLLADHSFFNS